MKADGWDIFGACLIGVIITIFLLVMIGFRPLQVWQTRIIEHNCGQYNPQTGEFEWRKP